MPIPTIVAVGAEASGTTGSVSYPIPTHQADDVLLAFIETANTTGATAPSGWAHITNSPRAQGSNVTAVNVLWMRAPAAGQTLTVAGVANHQTGFVVVVRGCVTSGDPWDFAPVGNGATATTSISATGGTTTVADTRTFVAIVSNLDQLTSHFSGISNSTLTSFALVDEAPTDVGNGGSIGAWSGTRTTAGATGTTTGSLTTSGSYSSLVFALVGAAASPAQGSGSGTFVFTGAGTGQRSPQASGSGGFAFTGAGSGARTPKAAGSGVFAFTGAGAGARTPKATGSGSWSYAGAAVGTAPGVAVRQGSGTGSWSYAGTATGKRTPRSTGAGTFAFTGAGTGKRTPRAAGTGAWSFAGAGQGKRTPKATAGGVFAFVGGAFGKRVPKGAGTGSYAFAGAAVSGQAEPTPPERTWLIRAEQRTFNVQAEVRVMRPRAESRTYVVPAEIREEVLT